MASVFSPTDPSGVGCPGPSMPSRALQARPAAPWSPRRSWAWWSRINAQARGAGLLVEPV